MLKRVNRQDVRPLPAPLYRPDLGVPESECLRISGIFVFNGPRDWSLDIQVITDLLLSRSGVLGTFSDRNGDDSLDNWGYQSDGQPPLFFSHQDLQWSTRYPLPRLGQGAFLAAVEGNWHKLTSGRAELRRTVIGKPSAETYAYAEMMLEKHRVGVAERGGHDRNDAHLRAVYMIGDNPESDIRGANDFESPNGTSWVSVLVRTGVWDAVRSGGKVAHKPAVIVDDVKAAVEWALKKEGRHVHLG